MSIELITASGALLVSVGSAALNYYKLKDAKKTWEHEQKISMEKTLLIKRLDKRYALYAKTFELLGTVRDIEYPKSHHITIETNKTRLIETADQLLVELYGEAGLFMEYATRSQILKTYQTSYRYANDEVSLNTLIDSYYMSRRQLRKDLEFDDTSGTKTAVDILKDKKIELSESRANEEKSIWRKKDFLARSARPGYPNKSVELKTIDATVRKWQDLGIKSIICLLSEEEISTYYKSINSELIAFYKTAGFDVLHVSITDYQNPPVNDAAMQLIDNAYKEMQHPVLVHCGAGEDRTGQVVEYLFNKYEK